MSTTTRRHGLALLLCGAVLGAFAPVADAADTCAKPLYLTFDTGHMGVAPLIAEVLARQQVRVTFFGAAERTRTDGDSLDDHWAPWWKARAAEGHEFASHTYDHVYWRGDEPGAGPRFKVRPSAGPSAGRDFSWSAAQYCADIAKASERLARITGKKPLPLFRAPLLPAALAALAPRFLTVAAVARGGETPEAILAADPRPVALVLGNEETGLDPATAAACARQVTLPGSGAVESLNVSVAAAVLMHAMRRG